MAMRLPIGFRADKLVVSGEGFYRYHGIKPKPVWHYPVKCDCGRETAQAVHRLVSTRHASHSCGKCNDVRLLQVGETFGRLTVKAGPLRPPKASERGATVTYYEVECVCGLVKQMRVHHLLEGRAISCGCYRREKKFVHGGARTRLWKTWGAMHRRCKNPALRSYHNYGGRGICVCAEWAEFAPFREWAMANGYTDKLSIERKDVNGHYTPENCTWIPMREQAANRRDNYPLTAFGETKLLTHWARDPRCPISFQSLRHRLQKGMSPEEAISGAPAQQTVNRQNIRLITIFGETKRLCEWLRDPRCSVTVQCILGRLRKGWSEEAAICTPSIRQGGTRH